jgi:hypothetical protein
MSRNAVRVRVGGGVEFCQFSAYCCFYLQRPVGILTSPKLLPLASFITILSEQHG